MTHGLADGRASTVIFGNARSWQGGGAGKSRCSREVPEASSRPTRPAAASPFRAAAAERYRV
jgi:hypothetical protein